MRPAWTQADSTSATPVVSTAQARNWVGLYGDTSVDDELSACVDAAIEKVAAFVGFRINDTAIKDYWPAGAGRALTLSEPGVDTGTVAVKYYDADGAEQTLDAADWTLDPTAEANVVVLDEVPALSTGHRYPLRVEYTSKLAHVRGAPAAGRIKTAVRMTVTRLWQGRGEAMDPHIADKALFSLLGAARIEPPVAA